MTTTATPVTDQIRQDIEKEVKELYQAKFAKEISDYRQELNAQNEKAITQAIDEFKKSQQPPTEEEIRTLLSQEYLTFTVKIMMEDKDTGKEKEREFVIRELPQKMEKAFYKQFKDRLLPRAQEFGELTFELLGGDVGKKITSLLETFEPTFDLMAEACSMILDPKKKESIDAQWVQDNLSSYRQWNIIYAQMQVNRLRDFFSQLSRGSKGMMTNPGAAIRS
jgi:hypothetical protein